MPAAEQVSPGRYRHFKGGEYSVLGVACHSETKQRFVVYHPVANPTDLWLRPIEMWCEKVWYDGRSTMRFSPLAPDTDEQQNS